MVDYNIIFIFALLMAFFSALIILGLPEEYQLIDSFDLTLLTGELIAISGTCILATGIPCAIVFIATSVLNVFTFLIVNNDLISLLVFTPITVVITYLMSKLARGN
jgi:hypothetical protein